jgi:hypothetical protein
MLKQVWQIVRAGCLALLCLTGTTQASDLPPPGGEVILTVTGQTGVSNSDGAALFDLAALKTLGANEFVTTTIWTEGENSFTGVPLATLLSAMNVEAGTLKATAINDYSVTFPVADALQDSAMVAYAMNGEPMSVRDKGPLWIIYPFDSATQYQTEVYYSRSIWQLDRIEFIEE